MNNKHEELSQDFEARDDFRKDFMLQDTEINMSSLKGTIKKLPTKNVMDGREIEKHAESDHN